MNKSTNKRQYFGSAADLAKNLKSAISACNISEELLKLYSVEWLILVLLSMDGATRGRFSFS